MFSNNSKNRHGNKSNDSNSSSMQNNNNNKKTIIRYECVHSHANKKISLRTPALFCGLRFLDMDCREGNPETCGQKT